MKAIHKLVISIPLASMLVFGQTPQPKGQDKPTDPPSQSQPRQGDADRSAPDATDGQTKKDQKKKGDPDNRQPGDSTDKPTAPETTPKR